MTLPASDNFTRANENPLSNGGAWSAQYNGRQQCQLYNNYCCGPNAGDNEGISIWTADTFNDDQYSEVTLHNSAPYYCGPAVRGDTSGAGCYALELSGTNAINLLWYPAGGGYTSLTTRTANTNWNTGDVIRLEVSGWDFKIFQNGTQCGATFTDTNHRAASGHAGVHCYGGTGDAYLSAWSGGNLGGSGTAINKVLVESMGLTDVLTSARKLVRTIVDALSVTGANIKTSTLVRIIGEVLSISGNVIKSGTAYLVKIILESVAMFDWLRKFMPHRAIGNGTVTDDGGSDLTEVGVCWNTTGTPTIADNHASGSPMGVNAFTALMTNLTAGQHLYVRAYATNSIGTGYGDTVEFDVPADGLSLSKIVVEAMAIAGNVVKFVATVSVLIRSIIDSLSLTDRSTRRMAMRRTTAEALGPADKSTRRMDMRRPTVETLGATDSSLRAVKFVRRVVEAITATDASKQVRRMLKRVVEALALTDRSLRMKASALKKIIVESIGVTENVVKNIVTSVSVIVRSIVDVLGLSDKSTRRMAIRRPTVESLGATDKSTRRMAMKRLLGDSLSITDRSTRLSKLIRRLVEGVGLTEAVLSKKFAQLKKVLVEALAITENVKKSTATAIKKVLVEALAIAENIRRGLARRRTSVESIAVAENIKRMRWLSRVMVEAFTIADRYIRAMNIRRILVEAVTVSDMSKALHKMIRRIVEAMAVAEASLKSLSRKIIKVLSEAVAVTDSSIGKLIHKVVRSVVEAIVLAEKAIGFTWVQAPAILHSSLRKFTEKGQLYIGRGGEYVRALTARIKETIFKGGGN